MSGSVEAGGGARPGRRPLVPAQVGPADVRREGHRDPAQELAEQPALASRVVGRLLPGLDGALWRDLGLPDPRRLRFVACGSSLNASAAVARVFRELVGLPTELVHASEAEQDLGPDRCLTVAVSQSGETADVLTALHRARGPVLAITGSERSSLARRADATVLSGVTGLSGLPSPRAFTAQVLAGSAVAMALCAARDPRTVAYWSAVRSFAEVPGRLEIANALAAPVAAAVAAELVDAPGLLLLSRERGLPYAAEGALELQRSTDRWAEALPAGELEHGALALVRAGTPVVVVDAGDPARLTAPVSAARARGGRVLRVGGSSAAFPVVTDGPVPPWGPLEAALALQHLSQALAVLDRDEEPARRLVTAQTPE